MDISTINQLLAVGQIDQPGIFPHLDRLKQVRYVFDIDFGLNALPAEGGILLVRGDADSCKYRVICNFTYKGYFAGRIYGWLILYFKSHSP